MGERLTVAATRKPDQPTGQTIDIYTDGSSLVADQSGGWAWWVSDSFWDAGSAQPATNNTMEMYAVTRGLLACQGHERSVRIVSDSAYVINWFQQGWYHGWRRRGWIGSTGKRVANRELWEELLTVVENYPTPIFWHHCRGHGRGGTEDEPFVFGNDRADQLCGVARKHKFPGRPFEHGTASTAAMLGLLSKWKGTSSEEEVETSITKATKLIQEVLDDEYLAHQDDRVAHTIAIRLHNAKLLTRSRRTT